MGGIFIVLGTYLGYFLAHVNFWTIGKGFLIQLVSIEKNVLMDFLKYDSINSNKLRLV